jgi:hypothetical protein
VQAKHQDTEQDDVYVVDNPNKPGWVRVGEPWRGRVPALVTGRPIGHIINDGATISIPEGGRIGLLGLRQRVMEYEQVCGHRVRDKL